MASGMLGHHALNLRPKSRHRKGAYRVSDLVSHILQTNERETYQDQQSPPQSFVVDHLIRSNSHSLSPYFAHCLCCQCCHCHFCSLLPKIFLKTSAVVVLVIVSSTAVPMIVFSFRQELSTTWQLANPFWDLRDLQNIFKKS